MAKKERKELYENSKDLEALLTQVREVVPEVAEMENFKVGILYKNGSLGHNHIGRCSKVPGPLRFKLGLDFMILIRKDKFLMETRESQLHTMIHEAYHIKVSEKTDETRPTQPAIREHEGNFCELREHDTFISGLVEKYAKKLDRVKSLPHQDTLGEGS